MTEPRSWDIGDPEPTDCTHVQSDFVVWNAVEDYSITVGFKKTSSGDWEADTDFIPTYGWDWPDVVRRFGPVREMVSE